MLMRKIKRIWVVMMGHTVSGFLHVPIRHLSSEVAEKAK